MFAVILKGKLQGFYNENDIEKFDIRVYDIIPKNEYQNKNDFLGVVKENKNNVPIFKDNLKPKNYISHL